MHFFVLYGGQLVSHIHPDALSCTKFEDGVVLGPPGFFCRELIFLPFFGDFEGSTDGASEIEDLYLFSVSFHFDLFDSRDGEGRSPHLLLGDLVYVAHNGYTVLCTRIHLVYRLINISHIQMLLEVNIPRHFITIIQLFLVKVHITNYTLKSV